MKLLLISDTHGKTNGLENIIDKYKDEVSAVFHMGDNSSDVESILGAICPNVPAYLVAGNCDKPGRYPDEKIVEINGKNILVLHGHFVSVKSSLNLLTSYAQGMGVDAVFFGHTHKPYSCIHEGIFFFNPGSYSIPQIDTNASYGIVEIDSNGVFSGEIIKK